MSNGKRQNGWDRRTRIRLECLEDRVVLSSWNTLFWSLSHDSDFQSAWQQWLTHLAQQWSSPGTSTDATQQDSSNDSDGSGWDDQDGYRVWSWSKYFHHRGYHFWSRWYQDDNTAWSRFLRHRWLHRFHRLHPQPPATSQPPATEDVVPDNSNLAVILASSIAPTVPVVSIVSGAPTIQSDAGKPNRDNPNNAVVLASGQADTNSSSSPNHVIDTSPVAHSNLPAILVGSGQGVSAPNPASTLVSVKHNNQPGNIQNEKSVGGTPSGRSAKEEPDPAAPVHGLTTVVAKAPDPTDGGTSEGTAAASQRQTLAAGTPENNSGNARGENHQPDVWKTNDLATTSRVVKANDIGVGANVTFAALTEGSRSPTVRSPAQNEECVATPEFSVTREVILQILPRGAAQLLDQLAIDTRGVDMAMHRFMLQIDNLGDQLSQTSTQVSLLGWAVVGAIVTTTIRSAHYRLRKKRSGLRANGLSDDSLSWMADLDSSSSRCVT